ncbi:leucine-rich repeat-containing protein 51-like isoform X1 [Acanthopagrus latus]|uniref:leucine-rich repeat-containing protein 51-like isoform X1 n=1 Tax=Acanthopagrus latus TaxID=8177 RepID=UPI00187BD3FD|nr:leucine-rich repeat-containing protein 51-like isoform X1 [Acanthopagrus latus]
MYGPPVDLSFKDISRVTGALSEAPRCGVRPCQTNSKGKYLSCSLRLSYNSIADLSGLHHALDHFLAQPLKLGWLDLSFNKLMSIDLVLCELTELRVLYLHGNAIWNLSEVDKLGRLQRLHTITLHGNAIETEKGYSVCHGSVTVWQFYDGRKSPEHGCQKMDSWCGNSYKQIHNTMNYIKGPIM